jgi:hypothetical protein
MNPIYEIEFHKSCVEDVCWHAHHPDIFGSVADDKNVAM